MTVIERPDFLRHIVNPLLARYSRERKALVTIVDEVRKLIALAEDKYGFSSFGGNPGNLAKYLRSRDFDLVISALKSANASDLVLEILNTIIEKYRDLPDVVAAAQERIQSLEKGVVRKPEEDTLLQEIARMLVGAKINETDKGIIIEYKNVRALLTKTPHNYNIEITTILKIPLDKKDTIFEIIRKIASIIEGKEK
ncbi:hypothetical protein J4526_00255 [Desulfurococcaceae archaeon MEX13E-LK6-19]|nr:hypothetical protein J4526_00255 [Desulfurococcaceae archaeon MEX13E-LK6-19]